MYFIGSTIRHITSRCDDDNPILKTTEFFENEDEFTFLLRSKLVVKSDRISNYQANNV
jgi:hypothetical protein